MKLLIVIGSKSDLPLLVESKKLLRESKIKFEIKVISSHRNLKDLIEQLNPIYLEKEHIGVVLAIAHSVANLPAIIAGYLKDTRISVIGVGNTKSEVGALESLLSVISIPKGVPMLNSGIGEIGIYNATLSCIKILKGYNLR